MQDIGHIEAPDSGLPFSASVVDTKVLHQYY